MFVANNEYILVNVHKHQLIVSTRERCPRSDCGSVFYWLWGERQESCRWWPRSQSLHSPLHPHFTAKQSLVESGLVQNLQHHQDCHHQPRWLLCRTTQRSPDSCRGQLGGQRQRQQEVTADFCTLKAWLHQTGGSKLGFWEGLCSNSNSSIKKFNYILNKPPRSQ